MNRNIAMKNINDYLKNDFKYLYHKKFQMNIHTIHLSFLMNSTHQLQMTLSFEDKWCDVLCFISPTVLQVGTDYYKQSLESVNYINMYTKANGRFYIDSLGDVAYSLRIDYDILDVIPHECMREIESILEYYMDVFEPLLKVCKGEMLANELKNYIDEIWGNR